MVAHRAAADVAVLAEIMRGLANVAGVAMQGLMTLDCKRKYHGSFQLYAGEILSVSASARSCLDAAFGKTCYRLGEACRQGADCCVRTATCTTLNTQADIFSFLTACPSCTTLSVTLPAAKTFQE